MKMISLCMTEQAASEVFNLLFEEGADFALAAAIASAEKAECERGVIETAKEKLMILRRRVW